MTVIGEVRKNPRWVTKAEATTQVSGDGPRCGGRREKGREGEGRGNQHVSVGERSPSRREREEPRARERERGRTDADEATADRRRTGDRHAVGGGRARTRLSCSPVAVEE